MKKKEPKNIGSSLEADLKIQLNKKLKSLTENIDFLNFVCLKPDSQNDIETTAITSKANGSKCSICWKIKKQFAIDLIVL